MLRVSELEQQISDLKTTNLNFENPTETSVNMIIPYQGKSPFVRKTAGSIMRKTR
jgi:hypothetical protein